MTKLLQQFFEKVPELPDTEQDKFVRFQRPGLESCAIPPNKLVWFLAEIVEGLRVSSIGLRLVF